MPRHFTATLPRRTILLIVAAALLLSQALGLLHRVVHAPPAVAALVGAPAFEHAARAPGNTQGRDPAQAHAHPRGHAAVARDGLHGRHAQQTHPHPHPRVRMAVAALAEPALSGHWLDPLFADHDANANACASYDQLAHADFLWGPPADVCAAVTAPAECASNPAWHLAAQAAGYLARGPPRLA